MAKRVRRPLRATVGGLVAGLVVIGGVLLPAGPVAATSPPQPYLTKVEPNHGPVEGGNEVLLTGYNMNLVNQARFGDAYGQVVSKTATTAVVKAPRGLAGITVDVSVDSYYSSSATQDPTPTTTDDYTYDGRTRHALQLSPGHGSPAGGTEVKITGDGVDFASPRSISFGGKAAQIVSSTASSVVVKTPAGTPNQTVQVELTTRAGNLEGTQWTRWTYDWATAPPRVTGISPGQLYASGGQITITGEYLEGAKKVIVGEREIEIYPTSSASVTVYVPELAVQVADVRVVTAVGTSENTPADDLTVVASPPPPVITAISPTRGSIDGGTVVTVRGRNLVSTRAATFSKGGNWGERGIQVVSDTEVRVTSPSVDQPGKADLILYTAGGSTWDAASGAQDDFTFEHRPSPITLSPSHGPATGGNVVRLSGGNIDFWRASHVYLDGYASGAVTEATIKARESGWLDVIVPSGPAGGTATVKIVSVYGEQINGTTDTYRWDATSTDPVSFGFAGKITVPTLSAREVPLRGEAVLALDETGGVRGTLVFTPVSMRLKAIAGLAVTAKLAISTSGKANGTLDPIGMTLDALLRVKITEAKLFGALPIATGNDCQAKSLSSATFHTYGGQFNWLDGGGFFSIFDNSDFNGCALLSGIFDPAAATTGNFIQGKLTRRS